MFPSHDAVVSAVPEYARDPLLDELESSTGRFAASHLGVELLQASASRFSSAHFNLSGEDTALQDELAAVMAAAGLPPHCGEPEVPYLATIAAEPEQNEELADLRTDAEAKVRDRASKLASQGACSPCYPGAGRVRARRASVHASRRARALPTRAPETCHGTDRCRTRRSGTVAATG